MAHCRRGNLRPPGLSSPDQRRIRTCPESRSHRDSYFRTRRGTDRLIRHRQFRSRHRCARIHGLPFTAYCAVSGRCADCRLGRCWSGAEAHRYSLSHCPWRGFLRVTTLLKPNAVPTDALVAVVSPASTPQQEHVERGLQALRAFGYAPQAAEHILTRGPLYFAGTPEMRVRDLHHAFADDEVRAIFSTRGGYGSNYLLDALDLDLIAESAKPFMGYSDLTALQLWLLDQVQLPAFHGPMLSADFAREDGVHLASMQAALSGQNYSVSGPEGLRTLHTGR